jgi:hypothetical protein
VPKNSQTELPINKKVEVLDFIRKEKEITG